MPAVAGSMRRKSAGPTRGRCRARAASRASSSAITTPIRTGRSQARAEQLVAVDVDDQVQPGEQRAAARAACRRARLTARRLSWRARPTSRQEWLRVANTRRVWVASSAHQRRWLPRCHVTRHAAAAQNSASCTVAPGRGRRRPAGRAAGAGRSRPSVVAARRSRPARPAARPPAARERAAARGRGAARPRCRSPLGPRRVGAARVELLVARHEVRPLGAQPVEEDPAHLAAQVQRDAADRGRARLRRELEDRLDLLGRVVDARASAARSGCPSGCRPR